MGLGQESNFHVECSPCSLFLVPILCLVLVRSSGGNSLAKWRSSSERSNKLCTTATRPSKRPMNGGMKGLNQSKNYITHWVWCVLNRGVLGQPLFGATSEENRITDPPFDFRDKLGGGKMASDYGEHGKHSSKSKFDVEKNKRDR